MKRVFFIIILIAFSRQFLGQTNLVPNGSFETYTSCPNASNQIVKAVGWVNPTAISTAEYFNSCSANLSVPYCCGAVCNCFQYAKTGNAYAGIWCYERTCSNCREYIQAKLTTTLVNGKCYYVGFYANITNWAGTACNKLGAYLSNTNIYLPGPTSLLNYNSQIKHFNNKIITDTLNWELISGVFTATNTEQYITIGNFNNDATTDTLRYNPSLPPPLPTYCYYNIDDVFVIPIDSMPGGMPAFAGNNVSINVGDSTFIGQQISNLNCTWYNGTVQIATNTSGLYVKPAVTTTYVVQQTLCGNTTTASVIVTVNPLNIDALGLKSSEFKISPNPNNGLVTIDISNKEFVLNQSVIKIYDVLSQEVKDIPLQSKKQTLDIQDLKNGIYYLQLHQDKNIILTKKIIKQ